MELMIIGSSGSASGPGNPASCYLVRHAGRSVVLDLGPGAFGALFGAVDVAALDALVLSHLHADHCLDAVALNIAARYGIADRWQQPLPLVAPDGVLERLVQADLATPATVEVIAEEVEKFEQVYRPMNLPDVREVGPFALRSARMAHPVEAYGVRLEVAGRSLVYSGDTGPCDALVELATGADVLLAEAGWGNQDEPIPNVHLTGRAAGEAAAAAGVGTLVLTHIPPWHDAEATLADAQEAFGGRTVLALPGMVLEV